MLKILPMYVGIVGIICRFLEERESITTQEAMPFVSYGQPTFKEDNERASFFLSVMKI